jgi:hypothetical protein
MTHPLTDEICRDLQLDHWRDDWYVTDMRAAADWQLNQVLTWLSDQGYYFVETDYEGNFLDHPEPTLQLLVRLMTAMRPQEDNS